MATFLGYAKFYNPSGVHAFSVPVFEGALPNSNVYASLPSDGAIIDITIEKVKMLADFDMISPNPNKNNSFSSSTGTSDALLIEAGDVSGGVWRYIDGKTLDSPYATYWGNVLDGYEYLIIVRNTNFHNAYVPLPYNLDEQKCMILSGYPVLTPYLDNLEIVDTPSTAKLINFYHSSSVGVEFEGNISLARGESSSQLEFTAVYSDKSFSKYDGEVEYFGLYLGKAYTIENNIIKVSDSTTISSDVITAKPVDNPELFSLITLEITNPEGPYDPGGPSGPGGGPGTFNPGTSDNVSPSVPEGTVLGNSSSTGMYTKYLMNVNYMNLLGDWMWDPNLGLSLIKTALESWYGEKASEALISLMSFPFTLGPPFTGIVSQSQDIYFGHQTVGAQYIALKSGGAQMDWGTIQLSEYWGNFLDYDPHTKIELYLPWGTGFVSIDPGQCLPGSIQIKTNIEFDRGSCVHNVINQDGCVIGTYMGQPGVMVPMLSSDIASKRAGMFLAAVGVAAGGAISAAGAGAVSAGQTGAINAYTKVNHGIGLGVSRAEKYEIATRMANQSIGAAQEVSSQLDRGAGFARRVASDAAVAAFRHPVSIQRNGGFGDASAGTMIQYPYIIISRPEQNIPYNYGHHYGYPSNIYESLRTIRGYTEIASIHLNGIGATASELSELEQILSGGVIF